VKRRTVIVEGPLAFRTRQLGAARQVELGLQVSTLPLLAARLAGGFSRPALSEDLEPAVREALGAGGFTDLEPVCSLPGMTRAVAATLTAVWSADLSLATLSHRSPRLTDLALLERRVREALGSGVLAPADLRDAAIARIHHAPAVLGPVQLDQLSTVPAVWRPLLEALKTVVPLSWRDPAASDTAWFPGEVEIDPASGSAPQVEAVSCADPHSEVTECFRWARQLLSSGQARPEEIAISAPSTDAWDEDFVTAARNSGLPIHFSNGVPALSSHEGQACAALADILVNGLSQDRIRRLLGYAAGRCEKLEDLPRDWARGMRREATLLEIQQWSRALEEAAAQRGDSLNLAAMLRPMLELLARGPAAALQAGAELLTAGAKSIWSRALSAAPPEALEFSLEALHVSDGTDPCSSIVWCPVSHLVGAARPWVRLLGLNRGSWPRQAREDPLLPDHLVPRRVLDPDPVSERDRRAFHRVTVRATLGCVLSRSRRDVEGRTLYPSALLTGYAPMRFLAKGRVPEHAASEADRLLARQADVTDVARLVSAIRGWRAWNVSEVTGHDGLVRADHSVIRRSLTRVQSATSLRLMLRDPLAFLWRYALGWTSTVQEEQPLTLSDRAFGVLVHELLGRAVDHLEPTPGYTSATAHELQAALDEAVAKTRVKWSLERAIPPPLLWEHTLEQGARLALRALAFEQSVSARTRCWTEVPFGQKEAAAEASWPWDPLTPVPIPGTTVQIGGKIDRLDLRWDGNAVRVSDYKTGKTPEKIERVVMEGGKELQRVIYAIAARQLLPEVRQVSARLVYLGDELLEAHKLPDVEEAIQAFSACILAACDLLGQGRCLANLEDRKPNDDFRLALPADTEAYLKKKRPALKRAFGEFPKTVWGTP
jgi:hypothetical protein